MVTNSLLYWDFFQHLHRNLISLINSDELSACLVEWLDAELPERCVIAVDGKTIKGSQNANHKAYHVVSAFVAESQITLGEVTVPKSAEFKTN